MMNRQYFGGLLAGIGVCAIALKYLDAEKGVSVFEQPLWLIGGAALFILGSVIAHSAKRRIEHRRSLYVPDDHRL
jgi:hypothetical protein